jgi:hypothetical protein
LHQPASFLEQIAASVAGLDLAAHHVRERHFGNLARKLRSLGCPIAENSTYLTANKFVGFTVGIRGLDLLNSGLQSNS